MSCYHHDDDNVFDFIDLESLEISPLHAGNPGRFIHTININLLKPPPRNLMQQDLCAPPMTSFEEKLRLYKQQFLDLHFYKIRKENN